MKGSSTPEACPFCGKPFKRLKSHLPHCKVAIADKNKEIAFDQTKTITSKIQPTDKKVKQKKSLTLNLEDECRGQQKKLKVGTAKERGQFKKKLKENNGPSAEHVIQTKTCKTATIKKLTATPEKQQMRSLNTETDWKTKLGLEQPLSNKQAKWCHPNSFLSDTCKNSDQSTQNPTFHSIAAPFTKLSKKQGEADQSVLEPSAPLLQEFLGVQNPSGKLMVDTEPHVVEDILKNHPIVYQTLCGRDADIRKEITTEVLEGKGKCIAAGKTMVWDHIKDSFCSKSCYEQWGLGFKQYSDFHSLDSKSSQIPSSYNLITTFALENTQLLTGTSAVQPLQRKDIHHAVTCSITRLEQSGQPFEKNLMHCLHATSKHKLTPSRDVIPACTLGLQWLPELYPNYVRLLMIPERQNQWETEKILNKTEELTGTHHDIPLASKNLMDVRLKELPTWLSNHSFSTKTLPEVVQKAWEQYYHKYINVKRGGIGGLTMLLAGYCILSYAWNYDHIKQDRWRKYH